jgi:CheY-like chemotaxis protein
VLDQLKSQPDTRHIPVHVITVEDDVGRGLKQGALAVLTKPLDTVTLQETFAAISEFVDRRQKNLLVVEDDPVQRQSLIELVGGPDIEVTAVGSAAEALQALGERRYDCMVLDLKLPDRSGFELLEEIKQSSSLRSLPVVIYTARELSEAEAGQLQRVAQTVIVKDARSPERLLDETALFLHRVAEELPQPQRDMLQRGREPDPLLSGRKLLLVDDDIRNIFALVSILERHEMRVLTAETGKAALETLAANPDVDIVLMDIMMPEMNGYDTIRAIRDQERFAQLPIIALTAKAMMGDREKCIEVGATDYIAKPVDIQQLLSLLRVWLYR